MFKYLRLITMMLVCAVVFAGCAPRTVVKEDASDQASQQAQPGDTATPDSQAEKVPDDQIVAIDDIKSEDLGGSGAGGIMSTRTVEGLNPVHFEFDKYTIRNDDIAVLNKNAEWLNKNQNIKVLIEGHADERGETEYNLALGEKRAETVKSYLINLGIGADRLTTITFGEEKPVDAAQTEEAWARNRRAEFTRGN